MIVEMVHSRTRLSAGALAVAGILFVLYPIIRPFSDEITPSGRRGVLGNRHVLQADRIVERVVELV